MDVNRDAKFKELANEIADGLAQVEDDFLATNLRLLIEEIVALIGQPGYTAPPGYQVLFHGNVPDDCEGLL